MTVDGKATVSEQGKTSKAAVLGVEDALEIRDGTASSENPVTLGWCTGAGDADDSRWFWKSASSQRASRLRSVSEREVERRRDILPERTLRGCTDR